MKTNITPRGKLSKQEALKSLRDVLLIGIAGLIPEIIKILEITDFGGYQVWVTAVLAIAAPIINRYLNIIRIK